MNRNVLRISGLRLPVVVVLALLACPCLSRSAAAAEAVVANAAMETESRILNSIKYLASDELGGRGIGSEGIDLAADFLAEEFRQLGLKTDLYPTGPFQEFSIKASVTMGAAEDNRLVFVGLSSDESPEERTVLRLDRDFTPLAIGSSGEFQGELAFVGYGISSEKIGYDDYAGIDVKDKVVIILRKEPQQNDPNSVFEGKRSSVHAQFRRKIQNAVKQGAAAVILVNDSKTPEQKQGEARKQALKRWRKIDQALAALRTKIGLSETVQPPDEAHRDANENDGAATTGGTEDKKESQKPTSVDDIAKSLDALREQLESLQETYREIDNGRFDPLVDFHGAGTQSEGPIPVFFASRETVDEILKESLDADLLAIEEAIDGDLTPRSAVLDGWRAEGAVTVIQQHKKARNVIAVLEGEGPLADETVVVGAHYDHLGRGGPGTLAPWTVEIHNGADDNASGTSALLEVAKAFATREKKPQRRMVFIAFSGEETGLLGSAHYVKDPRFPLEDTVAMVNLDMVGRLQDDQLSVEGTGTGSEFDSLLDRLNETHEFKIKKKANGYGPSDHASFYGRKIPVLFLFTGLHKDYHRPSDDWEKINIQGVRRVVAFAVDILDELLAAEERPTYVEIRRGGRFARGGNRVILGIIPDIASPEEGLVIRQLSEEGPAETAGLKQGDVITKVDETSIGNLNDLRAVLAGHKPNDVISVTVTRRGEQVTIDVTLKSAG